MRLKRWAAILLTAVFLFGIVASGMGAAPQQAGEKVDVLIGFYEEPNPGLVKAFGGEIYREFTIVDVIAATMPQQAAEALEQEPGVRYVEPDGPVYALETATTSSTDVETVPWGIDRVFGEEDYPFDTWKTSTGAGIAVAVLDTGIDGEHIDLDVLGGTNTIDDTEDWADGHGHGTHVGGTIAALDNDIVVLDNNKGVVGVSPGIDLYAVKVLGDDGAGTTSSVVAGIEWAVKENIPVLNMSLGSSRSSDTLKDACDAAFDGGHLLVAAAGNSGNPPGRGENVSYPAAYESVIAVAASNSDNRRASFSSTGPEVELIAPGVDVLSTWNDKDDSDESVEQENTTYYYKYGSGTSMSSPHVAGVAALVWAADSTLNNEEIREILQDTAEKLDMEENHQGNGLVRADLAVREVAEVEPPATGNIEGTVTNDGAIEGATVLVEDTDLSATTDENGYYLLEDVPTGEQDVTASADGYYSETATATVEEDQTIVQDFSLQAIPTYTVSGTVKDTEEEPIEGATVTINETDLSATTNEDGEYEISDVEKGDYNITASKDGYSSETKTVDVKSDTTVDFGLEETEDVLEIVKFDVEDTSNPVWARVEVTWEVYDGGGNLEEVVLEVLDKNDETVVKETIYVSGTEASGVDELRKRNAHNEFVKVKITVFSSDDDVFETQEIKG